MPLLAAISIAPWKLFVPPSLLHLYPLETYPVVTGQLSLFGATPPKLLSLSISAWIASSSFSKSACSLSSFSNSLLAWFNKLWAFCLALRTWYFLSSTCLFSLSTASFFSSTSSANSSASIEISVFLVSSFCKRLTISSLNSTSRRFYK